MKLVKGDSFAKLLGARITINPSLQRFLNIFEQICRTIAYAHARDIVHRDIKLDNILIGDFGEVQVVDWGMSKVLDVKAREGAVPQQSARESARVTWIDTVRSRGKSDVSMTGSVLGTPGYMPPEQATGHVARVDQRSDVFALGALLCEILTGQAPYVSELEDKNARIMAELDMAAHARLDDAQRRLGDCGADPSLVALCTSCLMPAQDLRPSDAEAVAVVVGEYLASTERRAKESRVAAETARHRLRVMVGVITAATVVMVVSLWSWQRVNTAHAATQVALTKAQTAGADAHYRAAKLASERGRWTEAVESFDQALAAGHSDFIAIELGKVYANIGMLRWSMVERSLSDLAKRDDLGVMHAQVNLLRGAFASDRSKDLNAGNDLIIEALESGDLRPFFAELAKVYLADDAHTMLRHIKTAATLDPHHYLGQLGSLAIGLLSMTRVEVREQTAAFLARYPEDVQGGVFEAVLAEQGREEETIKQILARVGPVDDELLWLIETNARSAPAIAAMDAIFAQKVIGGSGPAISKEAIRHMADPKRMQRLRRLMRWAPSAYQRIMDSSFLTSKPDLSGLSEYNRFLGSGSIDLLQASLLLDENRWAEAEVLALRAQGDHSFQNGAPRAARWWTLKCQVTGWRESQSMPAKSSAIKERASKSMHEILRLPHLSKHELKCLLRFAEEIGVQRVDLATQALLLTR